MPPRDNRNQSNLTKRGTRRKTKEELSESGQQAASSRTHEDELEYCQKLRASRRTYGDRLSEGFGMLGED